MFDVGFFEMLLIGVVALLVVGPERLPKLARTAGMWLGRGRRLINSVKADIDREIQAEQLRETIAKQKIENPLHSIVEDVKQDLTSASSDVGRSTAEPRKTAADAPHER